MSIVHVWEEPKYALGSYAIQITRSLKFISFEKLWMYQSKKIDNLSVIRQKRESQNGGNKKAKSAKFSEKPGMLESKLSNILGKTNISYALIRTCAYQGVRNLSFSEIFKGML